MADEKYKVELTISLDPEISSALLSYAIEHRMSKSEAIEKILKESNEFEKFLQKVRESIAMEEELEKEGIYISAGSPGRFLRKSRQKEEKNVGLPVGDPLKEKKIKEKS